MPKDKAIETEIREDKILEFKALTTTKRVFDQMQGVRPSKEIEYIGWVNERLTTGYNAEWFVGKLSGTLVRVSRREMWDAFSPSSGEDRENFQREAEKRGIGLALLMNVKMDEWRDTLPQIFLK